MWIDHLLFMLYESGIRRVIVDSTPEPTTQIFQSQMLVQAIKPLQFEFGISSSGLSSYRYASGEMILSRRDTQEWVRWRSSSAFLAVSIPDDFLKRAAEEYSNGDVGLESASRVKDPRLAHFMRLLNDEERDGFPSGNVYLDSILQAMASLLVRTRGVARRSTPVYRGGLAAPQLRRVLEMIESGLDGDLRISDLAREAGLSPVYFASVFRQSTGQTPHRYVNFRRMELAKQMLQSSNARILDVAISCGFKNQQHFSRAFSRFWSVPPKAYRNQLVR